MSNIGFIGLGVMGNAIVRHLLKHNYRVTGYTRTKTKALDLIDAGMIWADDIATVSQTSDVIFTMVGFPHDVEDIYLDTKNGLLSHCKKGTILVDLTTSKPSLAQKIHSKALTSGIHTLDAPVTGGDVGAKNGTLSMMVGGNITEFHLVYPLLSLFATSITYYGEAGMGQHAKMANQIAIANNLLGVVELLAYTKAQKIDSEKMLQTAGSGSASSWQLINNGSKMLQADFEPGFYITHFIKDLSIALEEASASNLHLSGAAHVLDMLEQLIERDPTLAYKGTQALWKYFI
ncbi:MAG: NAD(P)-dependent oxidoreductase [Culicoidibacterales bacterium]